MQETPSRKAEKARQTRAKLIATARALFAAKGFAETGTEEIVAAAGVTRGALYFHFADKTALFEAVMDEIAREVAEAILTATADDPRPVHALRIGAAAFIDACCDPSRSRIYLIDGPAALGAGRWRAVENRYSRPVLREGVARALAEQGDAAGFDADALAALLSGAMVEGALWLAAAPAPGAGRRLIASLNLMIDRLFAAPR